MNDSDLYVLNIGSKKYSSWSLRVWLLMKVKKIPFRENIIPFVNIAGKREFNTETKRKILLVSKTMKVPSLGTQSTSISESLPILEYLNDDWPEKKLWPEDIFDRAAARMLAGALYSSFHQTKLYMPFVGDGRKRTKRLLANKGIRSELDILLNILPNMDKIVENRYLYGDFSIADAMLIPLLMRYYCYNIIIPNHLKSYIERAMSLPEIKDWIKGAQQEKEIIKEIEDIYIKFPQIASVKYKL
ncbi:MAG: glutathione S-transferase family protein [Candidatus Halichondribacter symbioticus]